MSIILLGIIDSSTVGDVIICEYLPASIPVNITTFAFIVMVTNKAYHTSRVKRKDDQLDLFLMWSLWKTKGEPQVGKRCLHLQQILRLFCISIKGWTLLLWLQTLPQSIITGFVHQALKTFQLRKQHVITRSVASSGSSSWKFLPVTTPVLQISGFLLIAIPAFIYLQLLKFPSRVQEHHCISFSSHCHLSVETTPQFHYLTWEMAYF